MHKQILFDSSHHIQTLVNVQAAKYLSITITDNMNLCQHISEIQKSLPKQLRYSVSFVAGNMAFAPRSTEELAYKTLVRPKPENAAPI